MAEGIAAPGSPPQSQVSRSSQDQQRFGIAAGAAAAGGLLLAGLWLHAWPRVLLLSAAGCLGFRAFRAQQRGEPLRLWAQRGTNIESEDAISILRTPQELYQSWNDTELLRQIIPYCRGVERSGQRMRFTIERPVTGAVEMESEITQELENRLLAWEAVPGAEIQSAGEVRFEPDPSGRGSIVRLRLATGPSGWLRGFGLSAKQQAHTELRRFKQLMEAGEIATIQGQPHGQRSAMARLERLVPEPLGSDIMPAEYARPRRRGPVGEPLERERAIRPAREAI